MSTADEPDDRVPCPDGACTGVLGPDGTCGTCGHVGERPPAAPVTPPPTDADRDAALEANPEAILESAAAAVTAADADERVPCDDGTCTGVLGPDGRCGTCGRRAG